MKTALILAVKNQGEFAPWTTLPPLLTRGGEVVLVVGYPEEAKIKDYNRQKVKMIRCPYQESITQMFNQINELLGDPNEYDVIFTHGIETPPNYIDGGNIIQVKDRQEVKDKFNSLNTQETPSPQPAPQEKEKPKENKNKKKKAKEEKPEKKEEKEKASLLPPGTQEKEKEEKEEKKKEKREETKEGKKEDKTEASSEKEKEEKKKEKDEGDKKEKGKEEEKEEEKANKREEKKEEKQITYVFDPYTQENYRYLYPKKYMRTMSNSDDMKEWKDRWFGEQVYVSRLALMQAAWIICETLGVNEISNNDALQVIQLITRCRSYEDFNSSASNVLSNGKLRFSIDKNDPTSQDVAAASFKRLSQVASWYTALSRLLTEKIAD